MRIGIVIVYSLALLLLRAVDADELTAPLSDGVLYDGRVVCIFDDGTLAAWDAVSGQPDYDLAARLANPALSRLASDRARLWAVGGETLFLWDAEDGGWRASANVPRGDPMTLVVVDNQPALIYEKSVVLPTIGKSFKAPKLRGQLKIDYLRVLAIYASGHTLWIGTGQGEWGGHLVGLNVRNGRWRQYYDALHYVTGITSRNEDTLVVSWSMSHFTANTLIREHDRKAVPTRSYPQLKGSYFQAVAFSPFDDQLYGVEQNTVVAINDGEPTPIAELGKLAYDIEPDAIGVAPAVHSLIPVGKKTLLILHKHAAPFLLRGNTLSQLEW